MKSCCFFPFQKTHNVKSRTIFVFAIYCIIMLVWALPARAELATSDEMETVCQNWLTYIVSQTGDWGGSTEPEITDVQDIIENDTLLARYYAISPSGYIIVPALKELAPVKAYTEDYSLDIDEPGGMALMMREILFSRMQIFVEVYGSLEASQSTEQPLFDRISRQKWDQLTVTPEQFSTAKNINEPLEEVGPLLTTVWHQSAPYNALCPPGDGDLCIVGCVATAAAQIVWYYAWPPYGANEHSYFWDGDYSCGDSTPGQTLYADYSDPYYYDDSNDAKAELCYEMGVAYEMNYGACASGAWTMQGSWIYPYYYRYIDTTKINYRDEHTASSWFALIQEEIDMRRPILYQIPRHAIVCDGWRVADGLDQYHFNYGWGGSQNIWFTVDNLHCPWEGCDPMYEVMLTRIIPAKGIPWLRSDGFSDATSGNGNEVYEAGETVEMTFTIINYGGAALNDVTATLAIDDALLEIINGTIYYGSIPALDSVSNTGNPFTFSIPAEYLARTDSFTLAISWEGGSGVDTVILKQAIGTPTVLLVDDDTSTRALDYYTVAFDRYRIPYDIRDTESGSPTSSDLDNYEMVIWFAGSYRPDPLDIDKISAMKGYLDGGGQLFLNGQAIAAQLSTLDPAFLNDYLKTEYRMTKSINEIPLLYGMNGLICDTSDIIALVSGSGAGNQEFPDLIDSINGGILELKYIGQDYFGGVTYSGDYNLIFFSFGFEAIINGDSRWTYRDSLFSDILDFFSYQRPDALPEVTGLDISPGDAMNLTDHNPDLNWTYYDGSEAAQTMYQIQVGTDHDWSFVEMWDYGPISGDETHLTYTGLSLEDGEQYYLRVRVYNGRLWSDWYEGEIRMNSVPTVPLSLTPAGMEGVANFSPILTHENIIDGEADVVTYSYEIYDDPLLTQLIESAEDHPGGLGETTDWQVTTTLAEDEAYYWRVCACDPYENSEWSEPAEFWVNADNLTPASFDLVSPEDESVLEHNNPQFTWTVATDGDSYDQVRYTLKYGTDSTFAEAISVEDIDSTSYIPSNPLEPAAYYYWYVTAYDLFDGETVCAQTFSFSYSTSGDSNGDGLVDVGDVVFLINYVFRGGPAPDPYLSGDANCDEIADVGDAVYLVNYIFKGGPGPGCM